MYKVINLNINRSEVSIPTDAYEFKPIGRFIWLKRKLWEYLLKSGSLISFFKKEQKVTRVVVEYKKLDELIYKTFQNIVYSGNNPEIVYMGTEEFETILYRRYDTDGVSDYARVIEFDYNFKLNWYTGKKIYGLKICVLPYMKGVLIV